jgi:hypothetical protein
VEHYTKTGSWFAGPPEELVAYLKDLESRFPGLQHVNMSISMGPAKPVVLEQLCWFAAEVMPKFASQDLPDSSLVPGKRYRSGALPASSRRASAVRRPSPASRRSSTQNAFGFSGKGDRIRRTGAGSPPCGRSGRRSRITSGRKSRASSRGSGQLWNCTRFEEAGPFQPRNPSPAKTRGDEAMEPREPKQDEQVPEMDERPEGVIPEDDDPIDPDDDDTLGRPVQLEP